MDYLIKLAPSSALAAVFLASVPLVQPAYAGGAAGDYERTANCKELRNSGQLRWHAIASGTVNTGSGRSGFGGFVTKACHTSEASCKKWVARVGHEIPNLDTLQSAYCKKAR